MTREDLLPLDDLDCSEADWIRNANFEHKMVDLSHEKSLAQYICQGTRWEIQRSHEM